MDLFSSLIPTDSNSGPLSTVNYCAGMAFSPLAVPPMIRTRMLEVLTNTKQNLIWVHKVIKTEARDDEKLKLSSSVLTAFSCWPSNTRKNHVVDACNDHLSFYMHWCAPHLDVYIFCSIVDLIFNYWTQANIEIFHNVGNQNYLNYKSRFFIIDIPFWRLLTHNITN